MPFKTIPGYDIEQRERFRFPTDLMGPLDPEQLDKQYEGVDYKGAHYIIHMSDIPLRAAERTWDKTVPFLRHGDDVYGLPEVIYRVVKYNRLEKRATVTEVKDQKTIRHVLRKLLKQEDDLDRRLDEEIISEGLEEDT